MDPFSPTENPRQTGFQRTLRFVGVSFYVLSVRIALATVALVLWTYFAINSAFVADKIGKLANASLPGSVQVAHIQWGPQPGYIRIVQPRVFAPDGTEVMRAEWLDAQLSWWKLITDVAAGAELLHVRLLSVQLVAPHVRLDHDAKGRLKLALAFTDPDKVASKDGGAPFALTIDNLRARELSYDMDLNGTRIVLKGGELNGQTAMRFAPGRPPQMTWETHELSVASASMWLQAFEDSGLEQLPAGPVVVQSMSGSLDRVSVRGMSMDLPHVHVGRGDITVQLKPTLDVVGTKIRMTASTKAPFFGKMLGPLFGCSASVEGGFHFAQGGLFTADAKVAAKGLISGFKTTSANADIAMKLGHVAPDKADPAAPFEKLIVTSENVDIAAFKGHLRSKKLTYRLRSDGLQQTAGTVTSDEISLGQLVASPVLQMPGVAALALQGRLNGSIRHKLDLRIDATKTPALGMRVSVDSDLELQRSTDGILYREELPMLHLIGGVDYEMGPERGTSLALREVILSDKRGKKGPRQSQADQWIAANGTVDLGESKVELKTDVHLPDLATWLQPLGINDVRGRLSLRHAHVYGDLLAPTVAAKITAHNLHAAGWKVDDLSADLGLREGVLTFSATKLAMLGGNLTGDVDIHLLSKDLKTVHLKPRIDAVKLRVKSLPLQRVMAQLGTPGLSAIVDLAGGKVSVDLRRPVTSLVFNGQVRLRDVVVPQQRFTRIEANVTMKGGRLALQKLKLGIPPAAHGQQVSEVDGTVKLDLRDPKRAGYDINVRFDRLAFAQLGYVRGLNMPLQGGMVGTLKANGNTADLSFDADLQLDGLAWDKIYMGSGHARLTKKRGEPASITSTRFFNGFDLLEGSNIQFKKLIPTQIGMNLRAHDMDPFAFLGLEQLQGMRMKVNAKALFGLDFRPNHDVFFVDVEVPSGGMVVELEGGLDPLTNKGISRLKILPDRVDIRSTRVSIGREDLELCGSFLYPVAATNEPSKLLMYIAGVLDVPRFGALAESMATLDMRLKVRPTAALTGDTRAFCLRKPAKGAMRIAGPFDALRFDGTVRLLPSTLVPRGFGKEVLLAGGGEIDLRTDRDEKMVVTIPDSHPIEGRIEDGRFRTFGTAKLKKYLPDEVDFRFDAEDYEHIDPKTYSVVATPSLRFVGKRMLSAKPDMELSGDVEITEAAYIKSHDAFRAIGKGVISREASGYSEPFLDRHPEYKAMRLRLIVNGRNIEVTSKFPFLRTDVELAAQKVRVGGTLGAMRVDGRLEISHGSTITYELFKREFEVEKGFLDFGGNVLNPQLQIIARTDIQMSSTDNAQGSSLSIGPGFASSNSGLGQQNTVRVKVGVNGLLFDPTKAERGELELNKKLDISLSSMPPYDQPNLMALVLTGSLLTGGSGNSIGLGYVTNELSEVFARTLLSSFVKLDKFEVAPTIDGGAQFNVQQRLGRALSLAYKGSRGGSEEMSEARFNFRISEHWSMEGLARSTFSTQYNQRIYSATLRYRVPLETFQQLFGL